MQINKAKKIVIKLGSSTIVDSKGRFKKKWLLSLIQDIKKLRKNNQEIVIVSSGSIALGQSYLKIKNKKVKIEMSQAVASVGQIHLINEFQKLFEKNKIKIEKYIRKKVSNYKIIRLPELVGVSKNKDTLTNFLYNNILNSKKFVAYVNSKRNLLDVNDAIKLCFYFLKYSNKKIINIANPKSCDVLDIILIFKKILEILPIYDPTNIKSNNFKIKNSINKNILKKNKIIINKDYLYKIIKLVKT